MKRADTPSGRPFFQLNLSTALLLMLAASVLLRANITLRERVADPFAEMMPAPAWETQAMQEIGLDGFPDVSGYRGWPCTVHEFEQASNAWRWRLGGLFLNGFVAAGILFALAVLGQLMLRRNQQCANKSLDQEPCRC